MITITQHLVKNVCICNFTWGNQTILGRKEFMKHIYKIIREESWISHLSWQNMKEVSFALPQEQFLVAPLLDLVDLRILSEREQHQREQGIF